MFFIMAVSFFHHLANKYRRKICKDECLDECYQQFQHHHYDVEKDRDWQETITCNLVQRTKDEHQGNDTKDDNVTSQYVSKQSYHQ